MCLLSSYIAVALRNVVYEAVFKASIRIGIIQNNYYAEEVVAYRSLVLTYDKMLSYSSFALLKRICIHPP